MVKVYRSLNRVPFGVKWKIGDTERTTLYGNILHTFKNMPLPIIDPITLQYSNSNIYK